MKLRGSTRVDNVGTLFCTTMGFTIGEGSGGVDPGGALGMNITVDGDGNTVGHADARVYCWSKRDS
jgi:hypothetical protein